MGLCLFILLIIWGKTLCFNCSSHLMRGPNETWSFTNCFSSFHLNEQMIKAIQIWLFQRSLELHCGLHILMLLCCIFQPPFGYCALWTLFAICYFNIVCAEKLKKARKLRQKMVSFSFHPKTGPDPTKPLVRVLFP